MQHNNNKDHKNPYFSVVSLIEFWKSFCWIQSNTLQGKYFHQELFAKNHNFPPTLSIFCQDIWFCAKSCLVCQFLIDFRWQYEKPKKPALCFLVFYVFFVGFNWAGFLRTSLLWLDIGQTTNNIIITFQQQQGRGVLKYTNIPNLNVHYWWREGGSPEIWPCSLGFPFLFFEGIPK